MCPAHRGPNDTSSPSSKDCAIPWLWLLLGWVAGTAIQLTQSDLWPVWVYGLQVAAALGVGWVATRLARKRRWGAMSTAALMALAAASGGHGLTGWRAQAHLADALPAALEGRDIVTVGRIASLPQRTDTGWRFVWRVESATLDGQPVALPPRLLLSWHAPDAWDAERRASGAPLSLAAPVPGQRWRLTVRPRAPHGLANPHGFDRELWFWEQGLHASAYVRTHPRDPAPLWLADTGWEPLERWRFGVREALQNRVQEPRTAGVLSALVMGDQAAIDRPDWDLFRDTGVAHLMSISGLHITLFAWLATAVVGVLWRQAGRVWPVLLWRCPAPQAAALGGLALALGYALFAGWGVPAQRTVCMLATVVALRLSARRWPWPVVWLAALAVVTVWDPWALLQPGFWLSFIAVGVLFASGAPPTGGFKARARALLKEQALLGLALAPLSLVLFGQVSVVGLVTNLFAVPWVTLVVTPLALLGVVLSPLWDLATLAVQALMWALELAALAPWAVWSAPAPPAALAFWAVLGGLLLSARLPWPLRVWGLLWLAPALLHSPARPAPGQFEVLALDVGQGSAVLVRTHAHSLLYDAGPRYGPDSDAGERVIQPLLRALGERPDALVLSHDDSDHTGGFAALRQAHPQAQVHASFDTGTPGQRFCHTGQHWEWDGVRFEWVSPAEPAPGAPPRADNDRSCALRVSTASGAALMAGDISARTERSLIDRLPAGALRADWLLAPHHGSRHSSSADWLHAVAPRWVVVQSGYRNAFGHPSPEATARYRQQGAQWVATPACGAAGWRSAAPADLNCQRDEQRRYWHHPKPVFEPSSAQ